MLNYEQLVKPEDKRRLCALLEEAQNILNQYPYTRDNYRSNMDRLKITISQSISYTSNLFVDYSDIDEDK